MARLIERLKSLEADKRVKSKPPLIIIVSDEGLTDCQRLEIAEAEAIGQKLVIIMREDS